MDLAVDIRKPYQVSLHDISKLEDMCKIKFNIFEKILLVNNGTTEQILRVFLNKSTKIKIIRQNESKNILRRESQIITSDRNNTVLILANSKIYLKKTPKKIIDELRLGNDGIGMIILKHRFETYKKIVKIGYNLEKNSIFRIYRLSYKYKNICEINENFIGRFENLS